MERIQLVQFKLNEIQAKYETYFRNINDNILSFVNIEPVEYWVNVSVKENTLLPSFIADEIKNSFIIH